MVISKMSVLSILISKEVALSVVLSEISLIMLQFRTATV